VVISWFDKLSIEFFRSSELVKINGNQTINEKHKGETDNTYADEENNVKIYHIAEHRNYACNKQDCAKPNDKFMDAF